MHDPGRGEEPVCAERAEAGADQAGGQGAGLPQKGIRTFWTFFKKFLFCKKWKILDPRI